MGLLFVLIFWAILFCIISLPLGLVGINIANFYSKHKKVEVKKTAWFFAPTVLLFSFAGLFFAENVVYSIITDSDIGIGDYASADINGKYHIYWIDIPNWQIGAKDNPVSLFGNVQEILEHNDTIIFSAGTDNYYILAQLNPNKEGYTFIDAASNTNVLWNKYTQARGIDRDDVYTCEEYYWRSRKYFMIFCLIFNIFLFFYLFRRFKGFWKSLLIEKY